MRIRMIAIAENGEALETFSVTLPSGSEVTFKSDACQVDACVSDFQARQTEPVAPTEPVKSTEPV